MTPAPILAVEHLAVSYGKKPVLKDLSLSLPPGSILGILGPNGTGKTTFLKCLTGLLAPTAGHVMVGGRPLTAYTPRKLAKEIGYVPQYTGSGLGTTVMDTVLLGRFPHLGLFRRSYTEEDKAFVFHLLQRLHLEGFAFRDIRQLSGGERQRVFIARALAQESDLYIMDEPLAGVDETTERIVMDKFVALQKEKKTVIAVHHDLSTLDDYFDYLVVLNRTVKACDYLSAMDKTAKIALAFRPKER